MRVVYLHQHFRTPEMNGGTRSFEFARRLVESGHTVDVVTADCSSAPPSATREWVVTEEAGVSVHWCRVPYGNHMGFRERMAAFQRFCLYAGRRAAMIPQDVVVATSTPLTVAIPGVWSARRNGVPLVFEVRDVWPEVPIGMGKLRNPVLRHMALLLEWWAYRNSAEIIALSPDMRASIEGRFPDVRVTVVPNASDTVLFGSVSPTEIASVRARRPWLGDRPLVVYTGTFGEVNDVGYLVELAAELRELDDRVRLLLVGDGKQRAAIELLARRRGVLGKNVFIENPVPKQEMPPLLAAADLAVSVTADIPVLAANSANKVFDAFAAGTPVMVNHGGWLARLLTGTGAGFVVPARDPVRGAGELASRLTDTVWLRRAAAAARRLAEEEFDRDLLFRRFERTISAAVTRGRRS
jgi:glycosyltransferase involved in cell wall biosynthesis